MGIALALACAVFPLPAVRAADVPDAATLGARILAALGTAPASYHETIAMATGNVTSTEHVFHIGEDVRYVEDMGPIHEESGTFGGEHWHQNANGLTIVDLADPGSDASDGTSVPAPSATVAQSPDGFVLSDRNAAGSVTRTTIDPATYHVKSIVRTSRAGTVTTTFADYAPCATLTLPAHWTVQTADATYAYSRTACASGGVFPSQVREPGIKRLLADVPGNGPTQIPAKFDGTAVRIPVTIGARTFTFALDSGASDIVIDSDVASALGLKTFNPQTSRNAGVQTAYEAIVPDMTIGTVRMRDIAVDVERLKNLSGDRGPALNGLLGFDFFATLAVSIDYSRKRVTVTPATTYTPPADPQTMPIEIRLRTQRPEISIGLDGVQADHFVVDTGNGFGSYIVFDHFMDAHPKVGERFGEDVRGEGVGGAFEAHGFAVHSFRIGGWEFKDVDGYRVGQGSYEDASDGLIGPLFLKLFVTDFDYAHGRMYLTPTEDTRRLLHIR